MKATHKDILSLLGNAEAIARALDRILDELALISARTTDQSTREALGLLLDSRSVYPMQAVAEIKIVRGFYDQNLGAIQNQAQKSARHYAKRRGAARIGAIEESDLPESFPLAKGPGPDRVALGSALSLDRPSPEPEPEQPLPAFIAPPGTKTALDF